MDCNLHRLAQCCVLFVQTTDKNANVYKLEPLLNGIPNLCIFDEPIEIMMVL